MPCRYSSVPACVTWRDYIQDLIRRQLFCFMALSEASVIQCLLQWVENIFCNIMQQNNFEASSTFKWESFQSGQANAVIIVLSWDVTDLNTSPWCETKLSWQMRDFSLSYLVQCLHQFCRTLQDYIHKQMHQCAEQLPWVQLPEQQPLEQPGNAPLVSKGSASQGFDHLQSLRNWRVSVSMSYVLRSLPKFSTSAEESQRARCCQLVPHYSAECHISPFSTSVLFH